MKCYLKLIPLAFLAGCAGSHGGGGNMCAVGSGNSQSADNKALYTEQSFSSSGSLETFGLASTTTSSKGVKSGTAMTVSVKDSCQIPGPISSQLDRSRELPTQAGVHDYTWVSDRDYKTSDLNDLLAKDECVTALSDSQKASVSALPSDPMVASQDHLRAIRAGDAYPIMLSGNSGKRPFEVIAVIDTGIEMEHPDLADNLWTNQAELNGKAGVDDDNNGYVDDIHGWNFASNIASPEYQGSGEHHGTFVSGLAAARSGNGVGVSGVFGYGAKIMMLNVFGTSSGAYTSDSANAIRYAVDNGATVINMSLGGVGGSAAYEAAISYAISHGVTILAAAGNESMELGPGEYLTPAAYAPSYSGLISVGATNSVNNTWAGYSNYSATNVELAAPGSENWATGKGLLSTDINSSYSRGHGTSFATPVTSGAAALAASMIRARGYPPNGPTIEKVLTSSAQKIGALVSKVRDGSVLDLLSMANFIDKNYPQKGTGPYRGKVGASDYFNPGACN